MTYGELVKNVKKQYQAADISNVSEHVAIQFNVYGEGEGAFYLEIADGKLDVQPYEYYDRDAIIISTAEELEEIAAGNLDIVEANNAAKIQVEGSIEKAEILSRIAADKKAGAKKAATPSKKTESVKAGSANSDNTTEKSIKKEAKAAVKTEKAVKKTSKKA